jgi:hypothetical protein
MVVLASIAGAGGSSCTQEASVRIRVTVPKDPMLSPIDGRLALVSMAVSAPGLATRIQSRPAVRGQPIDLGEVPFVDDLTIAITASDAAGRLLGFGRSDRAIDVNEGGQEEVSVRLRRPFTYLIGGPSVTAIDPTFDITQGYRSDIGGTGAALAVAAPSDGKDVVVVEGTSLRLLDTATHAPLAGIAPVTIMPGARDALSSPDSQWLAISHATGVSLVKLDDLRAGRGAAQFFAVGAAGAIAFSGGKAWVLVNAASDDCPAPPSSLVAIDLATGTAGDVVAMNVAIADLAADRSTGTVLATTPCENAVRRVDTRGATPALVDFLNDVPLAGQVVALNGRVWVLGSVDAKIVQVPDPGKPGGMRPDTDGTAHLVLFTSDGDGKGGGSIALPVPEELAQSIDLGLGEVPGQSAEVRMGADKVRALDLAVLPDGSRLVVLWNGSYDTIFFGDGPLGQPVVATLTLTTSEYQLLDAATGTPLQRLRTRCKGVVQNDGALQKFLCVQSPGQDDIIGDGYAPTHVAVLFGER